MARWEMPALSIAADTQNGAVDWTKLLEEINALALGFSDHRSNGDVLTLAFDPEPDPAGKTAITAAVAAHDGVAAARGSRIRTKDGKLVEATSFSAGSVTWTEIT
ncbi:MAG: hypothetical protein V3V34_11755 [Kiloniellales bacterium]